MLDREHAAIAVADHHRMRKAVRGHPAGGVPVVGNSLGGGLKGGALGSPAVADRQDVVAAAIEGESYWRFPPTRRNRMPPWHSANPCPARATTAVLRLRAALDTETVETRRFAGDIAIIDRSVEPTPGCIVLPQRQPWLMTTFPK